MYFSSRIGAASGVGGPKSAGRPKPPTPGSATVSIDVVFGEEDALSVVPGWGSSDAVVEDAASR
eukprot:8746610-Heterocapsa_arctica.AAC.1